MPESHLTQVALTHLSPDSQGMGVLAFHGRNGSPEAMHALLTDLGWEQYAYALPRALNKTWYPDKFMAPLEVNKEQLDIALTSAKHHHKLLNQAGISDENIIIMGFSQGACLASQYVLHNPGRYKAIAVLTGGFIGPEGVNWKFNGDFKQTPVYLTTSEIDEWVPPGRAKETVDEFIRLNAAVTYKLFKNRPHQISQEEKDFLRNWF